MVRVFDVNSASAPLSMMMESASVTSRMFASRPWLNVSTTQRWSA